MAMSNVDQVTSLHKNNELQLLCFRLEKGKDLYAVNVFKIREVVKYSGAITIVSHETNSLVEGLITIRDLTIPLVDMRKWFFYDPNAPTKDLRKYAVPRQQNDDNIVMICEFSKWTIGVRIYEADRILNKRWTEIEQSGGSVGNNAGSGKLVSRTRYYDGRLVQVVDIEKMLVDVFPWIDEEKNKEMENIRQVETTKKILLADDSPIVIKTMQSILNKLGVVHISFNNGKKLLDYLFGENEVDDIGMIITDLEMPEVSGFEVIKQVKANPKTKHIPIVVNSSMSGSSNEEMALSLNANEFISKSNPVEVEKAVRELILR